MQEKYLTKIHTPFLIKMLRKLGIKKSFLNLLKGMF